MKRMHKLFQDLQWLLTWLLYCTVLVGELPSRHQWDDVTRGAKSLQVVCLENGAANPTYELVHSAPPPITAPTPSSPPHALTGLCLARPIAPPTLFLRPVLIQSQIMPRPPLGWVNSLSNITIILLERVPWKHRQTVANTP